MIHAHVDVLGVVWSKQHLVLVGPKVEIRVVLRNAGELFHRAVQFLDVVCNGLLVYRSVVEHAMFILRQILQQVDERLWVGALQFLFRHEVAVGVVGALCAVGIEICEIRLLALLGIVAFLHCHVY